MSTRSFLFDEQLDQYIRDNWLREESGLAELRAETAQMVDSSMQISPDQGQFLKVLLKAIGARKTLEIGVFTGYSSSVTAMSLPPDGQVIACDVSEEYTNKARNAWNKLGIANKISLRLGPAVETLKQLQSEGHEFDFVFIDADKPNYWNYFDLSLTMLRSGGLLMADNVLWSGRVANPEDQEEQTKVLREFNQRVSQDPRVTPCLVPLGDGLTLCIKN
jgi:predicted O-methyltransferase YrrM